MECSIDVHARMIHVRDFISPTYHYNVIYNVIMHAYQEYRMAKSEKRFAIAHYHVYVIVAGAVPTKSG